MTQTPNHELIEFDWNEETGTTTQVYEDLKTGAITVGTRHAPLPKPEVTDKLRDDYFVNLIFWLRTQPQDNLGRWSVRP
jgi:hypothetical protein